MYVDVCFHMEDYFINFSTLLFLLLLMDEIMSTIAKLRRQIDEPQEAERAILVVEPPS